MDNLSFPVPAWALFFKLQLTLTTTKYIGVRAIRQMLTVMGHWDGSGINIFDYHDGTQVHRKRFAVFPEFFDYSKSSSDLEIYKSSLKKVHKKVINGTATIA